MQIDSGLPDHTGRMNSPTLNHSTDRLERNVLVGENTNPAIFPQWNRT